MKKVARMVGWLVTAVVVGWLVVPASVETLGADIVGLVDVVSDELGYLKLGIGIIALVVALNWSVEKPKSYRRRRR